jgi:hypothetical protein
MISIPVLRTARDLGLPSIDQTHTVPLGRASPSYTFPGSKLPGYEASVTDREDPTSPTWEKQRLLAKGYVG